MTSRQATEGPMLLNTTPITPHFAVDDAVLQPLVDFVVARCQCPHKANIAVSISKKKMKGQAVMVHGEANKFAPAPLVTLTTRPSLVNIMLPPVPMADRVYPFTTCYRKSVGKVQIDSFEEEIVFVLAHELRHIDQFWGAVKTKRYEVDAELFAVEVLNEWRTAQGLQTMPPIKGPSHQQLQEMAAIYIKGSLRPGAPEQQETEVQIAARNGSLSVE